MQSMKKLHIMILGSSGRLGAALVRRFERAGHSVTTQSIRGWSKDQVDQLPPRQFDIVINAANPEYGDWKAQALLMCEAGIAIAKHYRATLMFPGNVYNFGVAMPTLLMPETPQLALNEKGKIRIAQEAAISQAARDGLKCIIVRAGDFFGAGSGNWFDLVITKKLAQDQVCYPGPLDQMHAWAYLPDLAAYFVQVAELRETLRPLETIHFEGHSCTGGELVRALEAASHRKLSVKSFPWPLLNTLKFFVPKWRGVCEMSFLWRVPHRLSNSNGVVAPRENTPLVTALEKAIALI
jgi:nucleoside-diphosphate-sugar epimerase